MIKWRGILINYIKVCQEPWRVSRIWSVCAVFLLGVPSQPPLSLDTFSSLFNGVSTQKLHLIFNSSLRSLAEPLQTALMCTSLLGMLVHCPPAWLSLVIHSKGNYSSPTQSVDKGRSSWIPWSIICRSGPSTWVSSASAEEGMCPGYSDICTRQVWSSGFSFGLLQFLLVWQSLRLQNRDNISPFGFQLAWWELTEIMRAKLTCQLLITLLRNRRRQVWTDRMGWNHGGLSNYTVQLGIKVWGGK